MSPHHPALRRLAPVAYLVAVTVAIAWAFAGWGYDDPYITFRYARNLASGAGFVYNAGERVLSTTTPLFTLILAAIHRAWPDLPRAAVWIGAASLAGGGLALWGLARAWRAPMTGWAALWLYPTCPLVLTTLGSEMPLYLTLCLGAFACCAQRRRMMCAVLAALAALTRADGVLVIAVILIWDLASRRAALSHWMAPATAYAALAGAWCLFAWAYFGTPLPVTLAAKQAQGAMDAGQGFVPGLLAVFRDMLARWYYWLALGLAATGIFAAILARRAQLLLVVAWACAYGAAYAGLGVGRYFWYYAPLVPGLVAAVGLGCQAVADWAGRRRPDRAALAGGALILVIAAGQCSAAWEVSRARDGRLAAYQAIGEWLATRTDPQAAVGALEVGIVGYYAQRRMVDFAGLLQPETAAQLGPDRTFDDAASWAARHFQPEYVVVAEGSLPGLERGYLAERCAPARRFGLVRQRSASNWLVYRCV
jgi:hypothetical protein